MDPINRDRLLRELTDFLRIPSVSTNASHNADCHAAAEWVAGAVVKNPNAKDPNNPPVRAVNARTGGVAEITLPIESTGDVAVGAR